MEPGVANRGKVLKVLKQQDAPRPWKSGVRDTAGEPSVCERRGTRSWRGTRLGKEVKGRLGDWLSSHQQIRHAACLTGS